MQGLNGFCMSYQENDTIGGGRYRIISRIGGGAMGEVYKAEQVTMHRTVAIKTMHVEVATNNDLVERFRREAIAAGQLQHSNICAVSDFDRADDGNFFIVMEMLEGESLQERLLRVKRMSPSQALNIIKQLLNALQCAHEHGIVHRDVKPENIYLVKRDNTDDFVKLIDFGIAHSSNNKMPTLTHAGELFGTPQYLSPEQAKGEDIDNRADLYACGIILYEMLVGRPPFQSGNFVELLNMQVFSPPPHLPDDIPQHEAIDEIIQNLLQKDPDMRYGSAAGVIEDIDNVMFMLNAASPDKAEALASVVLTIPQLKTMAAEADPSNVRSKRITLWLAASIVVLLVILIIVVIKLNTPEYYIDEKTDTMIYVNDKSLVPSKPEPFNYDEAGFKVSFDAVLSKNQNLVSAVENYPSNMESVAASLNAVKDLYKAHPNFMRLQLLLLNSGSDKSKDYDEIFERLSELLNAVPDAGRNESVRNIIFELVNSKSHYKRIMDLLSSNPNKEAATGIAWMIIRSPYDRYELRLSRLIECYDKYDHSKVPDWLDRSVDIFRLEKSNCSERFQMLIQMEAEKNPEFTENVLKAFYENRPKKGNRDYNDCLRSWLEQIVAPADVDSAKEPDNTSDSPKNDSTGESEPSPDESAKSSGKSKDSKVFNGGKFRKMIFG